MNLRHTAFSAYSLSLLLSTTMVMADPLIWEGALQDGISAAEGRYDLMVRLYNRREGGLPLGEVTEFSGVHLENGRFALPLYLDPMQQAREEIWLEVSARAAGELHFETLPSRSLLQGGQSACWSTTGNVVAPNAGFLGTTNEDGFLDLRAGNRRVVRYFHLPHLPESPIIIGGHDSNSAFFPGTTIAGGGSSGALANLALAPYTSIGGGLGNQTGSVSNQDAMAATVAGGQNNRAQAPNAVVGGGTGNTASAESSTIGGGQNNSATGAGATVGGGGLASANGIGSVISGGAAVTVNADYGTIGGGLFNFVNGEGGTVAGGQGNRASKHASTGGGENNLATGDHATIPGGRDNDAKGVGSLAAGQRAQAEHNGTFVWSDGQNANFTSTAANQFLIRAQGGAAINSASPAGNALRVNGTLRVDSLGAAAATSLCRNASNQISNCSSSQRYKEDIADLELGLATAMSLRAVRYAWRDTGAADVGFVAEEVGAIDERLVTRNADGEIEGVKYERLTAVLANAVQELAARDTMSAEETATLRAENTELRARLERLETLILGRDAR